MLVLLTQLSLLEDSLPRKFILCHAQSADGDIALLRHSLAHARHTLSHFSLPILRIPKKVDSKVESTGAERSS